MVRQVYTRRLGSLKSLLDRAVGLKRSATTPAKFRAGRVADITERAQELNRLRFLPRDLGAAKRGATTPAEFCGRGLFDSTTRATDWPGSRDTWLGKAWIRGRRWRRR